MHGDHVRTTCPDCGSPLKRCNFIDPKTIRRMAVLNCTGPECTYEEVFDVNTASGKVSSGS